MNLNPPYNKIPLDDLAELVFKKAFFNNNYSLIIASDKTNIGIENLHQEIEKIEKNFITGKIQDFERVEKKIKVLEKARLKNTIPELVEIPDHDFLVLAMKSVGIPSDIINFYENITIDNIINVLKEHYENKKRDPSEPIDREKVKRSIEKKYKEYGDEGVEETLGGIVVSLFSTSDSNETMYGLSADMPVNSEKNKNGFVGEIKALTSYFIAKVFKKGELYEINKEIKSFEKMKETLDKYQNGESLDIKSKEVLLTKNKKISSYQKEMGLSAKYVKSLIKRCVFKNSIRKTINTEIKKDVDFKKDWVKDKKENKNNNGGNKFTK